MQKHPDVHILENPHVLDEYLDGELDPRTHAAFETHLESCAACREELALARRVVDELRALPPGECPPAVTRAVLDAARPSLKERVRELWDRWTPPRHVFKPAFALLLAAALGLGVWRLAAPRLATQPPATAPPAVTPAPQTAAVDGYSAAEVARAKAEVELAFAYLGEIGRTASDTVGEKVLESRAVTPFTRTLGGILLPPRGEEKGEGNASSS